MNDAEDGCAYIAGANGVAHHCGDEVKQGSSYCPEHHAVCYVRLDSRAGRRRLAEIELAAAGEAKMVTSIPPHIRGFVPGRVL